MSSQNEDGGEINLPFNRTTCRFEGSVEEINNCLLHHRNNSIRYLETHSKKEIAVWFSNQLYALIDGERRVAELRRLIQAGVVDANFLLPMAPVFPDSFYAMLEMRKGICRFINFIFYHDHINIVPVYQYYMHVSFMLSEIDITQKALTIETRLPWERTLQAGESYERLNFGVPLVFLCFTAFKKF